MYLMIFKFLPFTF